MMVRKEQLLQAGFVLFAVLGVSQGAGAHPPQTPTLAAAQKAVTERFKELEKTSTVRLIAVTTATKASIGPVLEIGVRPPTAERFEFHAETSFALLWQALAKVRNAFTELRRVQLTLSQGRTMIIDCPIKTVEESYGYTDFARLKKQCQIR
jgi:hypothetical protein